jgi:hypothetical protein
MSALARRLRAALLASFAVLAAADAAAEAPAPPPGTVIEWRSPELTRARRSSDWQRETILAVDGGAIRYRDEDETHGPHGTEVTRIAYRGLVPLYFQVDQYNPERREHRARTIQRFPRERAPLAALFPLKAGARIRLPFDVEEESYADLKARPETGRFRAGAEDYAVERQETVEMPAGRFETFVILVERIGPHDLDNPGDPRRRERRAERIWYAPAIGWPVKRQRGPLRPDGSVDDVVWHVVEIRRP